MSVAVRVPQVTATDILGIRRANSLIGVVNEPTADNRRWAHRRASATQASLIGHDMGDPVPCVILDSSSTGARVKPHFARGARFQSLKDLPDKFTLFYTFDRVAIDCKIAWRRDGELGLKFTSPARTMPKPPSRPTITSKAKR